MNKINSNFEIPIFDEFYNNSWFTSNLSILYRICKEDNLLNIENFYKTVSLNNVMTKDIDTLNLLNKFIINIGENIEDLKILNKETKKYKYVKNTYSIYGNEERVITKCGYKVCFYIVYVILKHILNKEEVSRENIKKDEFIELELDFSPLIKEINQNTRLHANDPKNENRKKQKEEEEKVKEMLNKKEKNNKEKVNESLKNKEQVNQEQVNQLLKNKEQINQEQVNQLLKNKEQINQEQVNQLLKNKEQVNQEQVNQLLKNKEQINQEQVNQLLKNKEQINQEQVNKLLKNKEQINQEQVNQLLKNKAQLNKKEKINQKGSGNLISNTFGKGLGIVEKGFKSMNKVSGTLTKGSKILDRMGLVKRINKPIQINTSKVVIKKKQINTENKNKKGCACERLSISSTVNKRKKERDQALQNKLEAEETQKIIERIGLKEKIKLNEELAKGSINTFINNNNYIINISTPKKIKVPLYKLYLIYAQIAGITQNSEIKVNNIDSFYSLFFWEPLKDILYNKIKFLELVENIIPNNKKKSENNNNEDIYKLLKYNNKKNINIKDKIKTKYILVKKKIKEDNSIISYLKEKFDNYTLLAVLQTDNKNLYSTYFNENNDNEWEPETLNYNILYLFQEKTKKKPTPSAPPLNKISKI